jgi:hypothetical protein
MKAWTSTMVASLILTLGALAFAGAPPATPNFDRGKTAVVNAGIDVKASRMDVDTRKQPALLLETDVPMEKVVLRFMKAHEHGEKLNGATVAGWAHQPKTDTWNITLRFDKEATVLSIRTVEKKTRILVRKPITSEKGNK